MFEPTETEAKETLDEFADAMITIAKEAEESPETVQEAPHTTVIKRLDETLAARKPVLRHEFSKKEEAIIIKKKSCLRGETAFYFLILPVHFLKPVFNWEMFSLPVFF